VTTTYDVVVVGAGAMGSAVLCQLALRGQKVLGLDRFMPPHDRGSSHGRSRVIRKAYFEDPRYVPLLERAYALWRDLERRTGETLLVPTGCLHIGPESHPAIAGVAASVAEHQLAHEWLSAAAIERRFAAFRGLSNVVGVYEPEGGMLWPERAIETQLALARAAGAELRAPCTMQSVDVIDGARVRVHLEDGSYAEAPVVILCLGPWASSSSLCPAPLRVTRQVQLWFTPRSTSFGVGALPCFVHFSGERVFYGLPDEGHGVKVCEHHGGQSADPDALDRMVTERDVAPVRAYLTAHLPLADGPPTDAAVCMYTCTPDDHFAIGRHPEAPNVLYAAGFSGHGFKFAPVIGEILTDLAVDGHTRHAIEWFDASRFGRAT
jgi:sarcosine oxidase